MRMALFRASTDSSCAILSAKAAWATAKDAEVAAKVRNASMMARKSRGDIGMDSMGGAEVLGPAESEGTGGIGGVEDAGDARRGTVTDGVMDAGIWGSSVGIVGGG